MFSIEGMFALCSLINNLTQKENCPKSRDKFIILIYNTFDYYWDDVKNMDVSFNTHQDKQNFAINLEVLVQNLVEELQIL